jgi:hypothetical protein
MLDLLVGMGNFSFLSVTQSSDILRSDAITKLAREGNRACEQNFSFISSLNLVTSLLFAISE